jgi:hypothetical protein
LDIDHSVCSFVVSQAEPGVDFMRQKAVAAFWVTTGYLVSAAFHCAQALRMAYTCTSLAVLMPVAVALDVVWFPWHWAAQAGHHWGLCQQPVSACAWGSGSFSLHLFRFCLGRQQVAINKLRLTLAGAQLQMLECGLWSMQLLHMCVASSLILAAGHLVRIILRLLAPVVCLGWCLRAKDRSKLLRGAVKWGRVRLHACMVLTGVKVPKTEPGPVEHQATTGEDLLQVSYT